MTNPSPDHARRRLLARARDAAAGAAALAVLPAGVPAAAAEATPAAAAPQEPAHRGYRESERARRYYALARF